MIRFAKVRVLPRDNPMRAGGVWWIAGVNPFWESTGNPKSSAFIHDI